MTPVMFPGTDGQSTIRESTSQIVLGILLILRKVDTAEGFTHESVTCPNGYGWHCITLLARHDQAKALSKAGTFIKATPSCMMMN